MRIGFLYNHDQIHQVAHSLPVAWALADEGRHEIILIATSEATEREIRRLARLAGRSDPAVVALRLASRGRRLLVAAFDGLFPLAKMAIYGDHLDFFRSFDALVVAEKTSAILKTRYGLEKPCLIHTRHGAGDRAVGFDETSADFDLVLVSGPKIRERLIAETSLTEERTAMVGYPKLDIPRAPLALKFSGNGRPTVLYNPHPSPYLSSWYKHGRAVLDFFLEHPDYNLIFAPHIMLFERRVVFSIDRLHVDFPGTIPDRYRRAPNIHVDIGSPASTDMRYTMAADLYLGDASSQIYEYLVEPRPALFINSHGAAWEGDANFSHWRAGPVIDNVDDLGGALERAFASHGDYRAVQEELFSQSIDLTATPSSIRAAAAIDAYLSRLRAKAGESA